LFMHLADAFIQSDLRKGSCLRTPTGDITFHAGDLNPGQSQIPEYKFQNSRAAFKTF